MHDGDLEHCLMEKKKIDVHMIFISFLYSGILKMLIHVCFRDVLQPAVY